MDNSNYRLLQLINTAIGPVAAGAAIPLGVQNRAVETVPNCRNTFTVTTTANNVVNVHRISDSWWSRRHYCQSSS